MNTEGIAAPLAAALAAKGYETLTSVQTAVLGEGVAGRDLLVSAQTGSGKTVAFGLAIAPELLAGAERLLYADTPMALIIAPTRELAQQVAAELTWLYAEAGAHIATCVGGMDYRTEKRALERGAHIVVGTPGRLRDHIERKSLDLSNLKAAVLDEADEMLDMGFQEDLEFILSAAPETRRTLMFSATVPKDIAELAKTYQNDALRIQAAGEARQHVDIEYRALSVAVRDKEHAIFNVLRFYESRTAIVFAKTRMAVNHLLARMTNRGFQVVALSGELSQSERMHALQALRDGRARVCIATDVAARGIDLPGLDLVIHADLPSNSEVLLHRSGRTGRAGQKGVSALIVTPAEYRKAQRLLQGARVVAEWGAAPSAEEISARDDERLMEDPALTQGPGEDAAMAARLLDRFGADQVAAAFLRLWRKGRSAPEVIGEVAAAGAPPAPRERGEFGASVWVRLSVGRSGRAEARWLLPKICDAGGITKNEIGAIRVQEDQTFVQIAAPVADRFRDGQVLEEGVVLTRLAGEPALERPERPARTERPAAPRPVRVTERVAPAPAPPREKPAYVPKPPRVVEDEAPAERNEVRQRPDTPKAAAEKPAKPRWTPDQRAAPKSQGYKSHGGASGDGKPARSAGYKSHGAKPAANADRPYRARAEDRAAPAPAGDRKPRAPGYKPPGAKAEERPFRARGEGTKGPGGGGKPFRKPEGGAKGKSAPSGFKGKPAARPARPAADPKDTSRRFVPPKKPKS